MKTTKMALLRDNTRFRFLFLVDILLLLFVIILQAAYLDYILLKLSNEYVELCVFVILDFVVISTTVRTFVLSYQHFSEKHDDFLDGKKRSIPIWFRRGTLPMSYFTWFAYVSILLLKLASLCIKSDLSKENPQILQVCLAVSTIVFMLLVEAHNWRKKSSESYSFIAGVCKKNGIEIFDSVEILELFFTPDRLTRDVKFVVFFLAAFNFMLPTLSLYRLSLSDFGTKNMPLCLPLKILQNVLRFIFIDVPFFVIRLHIWIIHRDLSMFMMKNVFNIVMSVRELYLDICAYFKPVTSNDEFKESGPDDIPLNTNNEETQTDNAKVNTNS